MLASSLRVEGLFLKLPIMLSRFAVLGLCGVLVPLSDPGLLFGLVQVLVSGSRAATEFSVRQPSLVEGLSGEREKGDFPFLSEMALLFLDSG